MVRRLIRLLAQIFQPLDPTSRLSASVQIIFTVGATGVLASLPLFTDWTWRKAAFVALAAFAMLSLRAAYRSMADKDALLADTQLGLLLAARVKAGRELQQRLKMAQGDELPRPLVDQVINWAGTTITEVHAIAPELGERLSSSIALMPDTKARREHVRYMRRVLGEVQKLARDIQP